MRIAVFGKGVELVLGGAACELGGDWFGGLVVKGGMKQRRLLDQQYGIKAQVLHKRDEVAVRK